MSSDAGKKAKARPPALRSSCDMCTASKVGCRKEKPTCARCEKRGLQCSYSPARRVGRPMFDRTKQASRASRRPADGDSITISTCSPATTQPVTPPSNLHTEQATLKPALSFGELDELVRCYASDTVFDSTDFGLDYLNDMDVDMAPVQGLEAPFQVGELADRLLSPSPDHTVSLLPTPLPAFSPGFSFASKDDHELTITTANTSNDLSSALQQFDTTAPCPCLVRALGLMSELSPEQIRRRSSHVSPLTLDRVLARNQSAIDAMHTILECQCGPDAYLLVVLALIIFKVLAWFGAAATAGQANTKSACVIEPSTSDLDGWESSDEKSQRWAAQQVLSQLHRVQELVDILSKHLHGLQRNENMTENVEAQGPETIANCLMQGVGILEDPLLTTALFKSLEKDLRNRYRLLARSVIVYLQT